MAQCLDYIFIKQSFKHSRYLYDITLQKYKDFPNSYNYSLLFLEKQQIHLHKRIGKLN